MKIAVVGGAGAMARTTILDLSENDKVKEILVADFRADKAEKFVSSFNDPRIKSCFVDAYDIDKTSEAIRGYDAVINDAQHYVNIPVMKACLKSGCHYNDLGGLHYTTLEQLKLFDEFKAGGLTAVLCIGGAPGITNILARYGYDRLDTVEVAATYDAIHDMTDMQGIDAFVPGYSIRTIMEEMSEEPVEFIDGEFKKLPPLSGAVEVDFPEPIGRRTCVHTLHSEPTTMSVSFKDKGIREATWRLSLPYEFEKQAKFLAMLGFANKEEIDLAGNKIVPLDILAALIERHVEEKLAGVTIKVDDVEVLRGQVIGTKDGKKVEYNTDCVARTHSRWGGAAGDVLVGCPPAIVAQMQIEGMVDEPGVWAPEQVVDPDFFFKEAAKREMKFEVNMSEKLTWET